jgi:hypothetical protein
MRVAAVASHAVQLRAFCGHALEQGGSPDARTVLFDAARQWNTE